MCITLHKFHLEPCVPTCTVYYFEHVLSQIIKLSYNKSKWILAAIKHFLTIDVSLSFDHPLSLFTSVSLS